MFFLWAVSSGSWLLGGVALGGGLAAVVFLAEPAEVLDAVVVSVAPVVALSVVWAEGGAAGAVAFDPLAAAFGDGAALHAPFRPVVGESGSVCCALPVSGHWWAFDVDGWGAGASPRRRKDSASWAAFARTPPCALTPHRGLSLVRARPGCSPSVHPVSFGVVGGIEPGELDLFEVVHRVERCGRQ